MHFSELQYETNNYMDREKWSLARTNLKELLKYYYELYEAEKDQQNKEDVFFTLIKIGITYNEEKNYQKCIIYYLKARKFYVKNSLDLEYGLNRIHNRLYSCFMSMGKDSCAEYFDEFRKFHGKHILLDGKFTEIIKKFWKQDVWNTGYLPFLVDRHGKCLDEIKRKKINQLVLFLSKEYGSKKSYIFCCLQYIKEQAMIALRKENFAGAEALRGLYLGFSFQSVEHHGLQKSTSGEWISRYGASILCWGDIKFLKKFLDATKSYNQEKISKNSCLFWDNLSILVDNNIKEKNKKNSCYLIKLIKENIEYALNYDFEKSSIFNMYGCLFFHTHLEHIPTNSHSNASRKFFLYYGNRLSEKCCYWEDKIQQYKNYWRMAKNWRELDDEEEYNRIMDKIKDVDVLDFSLRQKRQIRNYIFDMLKRTSDESLSEDIKSVLVPLREDISSYMSIIDKKKPAPFSDDIEKIDHVLYCISCNSLFVVKDFSTRHCPECGSNDVTLLDTNSLNIYLKMQAKLDRFFGSDYEEDDIEEIDFVYKR